jgi:hypothetical protein
VSSETDLLLARIDERTELILASLQELKGRSDRLDKAVFVGNGQPPLLERVGTLETRFDQFLVVCTECRRIVYAPKPEPKDAPSLTAMVDLAKTVVTSEADVKKTITLEKWKFYGLMAAGVFTMFSALVGLARLLLGAP